MQKNNFNSSQNLEKNSFSKNEIDLIFSQKMRGMSAGKRVAFIAIFAALSVVANTFLEIRIFDIQYSLTIFVSVIIGVVLGPVAGFASSFVGDLAGYVFNSWGQLYMPWVGFSTATLSFIAGFVNAVFHKNLKKPAIYLKYVIICLLSLFVCTIAINSTGFYFFNKSSGFSTAVLNYVAEKFGGKVSYFSYVCYRLFFKGQILNNLVNYALLFIIQPIFRSIPILNDFFS